jgi:CHAT domain
MNITVIEACRSPEVEKGDTEGLYLSRFLKGRGVDVVLFSNDGIWPDRVDITREIIQTRLRQPTTDIIHLAMHGFREGLALRWSNEMSTRDRVVLDMLPREEIREMSDWNGKLVVSGACQSSHIAQDFVTAGARGVVAPATSIPWDYLGPFFGVFYDALGAGTDTKTSLKCAKEAYPKYESFTYSEPL